MWVVGTANGTYLRRSLKTASCERATELSRIIEESDKPAETPEGKNAPVTIVQAVTEYLADAKARELADATLYKLKIQLEKQFLGWCKAEGYKLLKEFDLRAAQSFPGLVDRRWICQEKEARAADRVLLVLHSSRLAHFQPNGPAWPNLGHSSPHGLLHTRRIREAH
jgi:hypothetical protein